MRSVQVILNPNAAGGRASRIQQKLEAGLQAAGHTFQIQRTRAPGHAGELAEKVAAAGDADALLVVGGDGTIHEVVNGLLARDGSTELPMAVLPVGTGNDFYRMVRAGGGVEEALAVLGSGTVRHFDLGRVRWEGGGAYMVNLLGVGVDVEVLRRRERFQRLSGLPQYMAALVSALFSYRPVALELELEEEGGGSESLRTDVLLAAVTVGPTVGGGFRLSPRASPEDGLLDLFLVEPLGVLEVIRYLPRVLRGTHGAEPNIHLRTLTRARIEAAHDTSLSFELDGELAPLESPWLELQVLPGALPVLDHPSSSTEPNHPTSFPGDVGDG